MEWTFPMVAFQINGNRTITMKIPEPLAKFMVSEVRVRPIVHELISSRMPCIASEIIGQKCSDDCLIVRPPEFHVVAVLLWWLSIEIAEGVQAAKLLVPPTLPHQINDLNAKINERLIAAMAPFFEDEPPCFDGMARIQETPIEVIHNLAVMRNRLHDGTEFGLEEIAADLLDAPIYDGVRVGKSDR